MTVVNNMTTSKNFSDVLKDPRNCKSCDHTQWDQWKQCSCDHTQWDQWKHCNCDYTQWDQWKHFKRL